MERQAELDELFAQVLAALSKEGLITLETVMQDGTKIKALASTRSYQREGTIQGHLEREARLRALHPQSRVLPGKSEPRPRTATASGKHRNSGVSGEDGQPSSTSAIPSAQPGGRVLSRVDQKQAGPAAVSRARFSESADGDALGLLHLQLATLDSPKQAPRNSRTHLSRKLQDHKHLSATTIRPEKKESPLILYCSQGLFHSFKRKGAAPGLRRSLYVDSLHP